MAVFQTRGNPIASAAPLPKTTGAETISATAILDKTTRRDETIMPTLPKIKAETNRDLSNNGRFDFSEAAKNFGYGLIKIVPNMIEGFKKHPIFFSATLLGTAALTIAAPATLTVFAAIGMGYAAYKLGSSLVNITRAILSGNGDVAERYAMQDLGEAITTGALTAISAKPVLNSLNVETKGMSTLGAVRELLSHPTKYLSAAAVESYTSIRSGQAVTNLFNFLSNTIKSLTSLFGGNKMLNSDRVILNETSTEPGLSPSDINKMMERFGQKDLGSPPKSYDQLENPTLSPSEVREILRNLDMLKK